MPATLRFDLVDLRLFLHVIDTGSITAGSKLSHLALASASARIRGMEDALGVPLLERLRAGVKPTKAGLAVAHHARLVLQQIDRMHGEINDYAGGLAGKVRLLSNTAAITDYLPQALADFLNNHPAMDVELEERPSHLIVSQLLAQVADLGIVADSADLAGLESKPFRRDQLVLVAPAHPNNAARLENSSMHSEGGRGTGFARPQAPPPRGGNGLHAVSLDGGGITFSQALAHDFVGLDEESAMHQHLALQAERLGLRMRTRIRLRSFEAVCRMVEAGVGVAVVPAIAVERHAGLRVLTLTDAWADRQLLICARRFEQLSVPALKLVEALCAPAAKPGSVTPKR